MQKVKFATGRYEQLVGYIAGIPCVPGRSASLPRAGETWLVEITGSNAAKTVAYVRAVRPWQGTPEDHRAVVHAHADFRDGTLKFRGRFAFPLKHTVYAQLWEDYRLLAENIHAVIIRGDKAIRWNRQGGPPQVLPLQRFATKYKRQRLLGEPDDVDYFLTNLEALRAKTIEDARRRAARVGPDNVRA
ncbi:MAG: hypothetical protein M0Z41_06060 [Peptococcaceae bacterium]|jgi:hypothetical protein|nr:hypothetical protein [Peptococcaceae bacterium]